MRELSTNTAVLEKPEVTQTIAAPTYRELASKAITAYQAYIKSHRTIPDGDLALEVAYVHSRTVLLDHYPVVKNIGIPIPSYKLPLI